jgi:hypothetical protein
MAATPSPTSVDLGSIVADRHDLEDEVGDALESAGLGPSSRPCRPLAALGQHAQAATQSQVSVQARCRSTIDASLSREIIRPSTSGSASPGDA